ncbi:MAG: hypothetical protein CMH56_10435 [Myxococcales bacterium]|nr:hypothetical protein [Myxococcales bacterium]
MNPYPRERLCFAKDIPWATTGPMTELFPSYIHGLCLILGVFSWHRLYLLWLGRHLSQQATPVWEGELPPILVQVPLYNEPSCCERVVRAVGALDYPSHLLSIQILDDSTDETSQLVKRQVAFLQAQGLDICHVRRSDRKGFKAGALAHGLTSSAAPFVAVFDADFVPKPDFLRRLLPHFDGPGVGMVQARWGHLNGEESWLTRAQATLLNAHFSVEHRVRNGLKWFFNFNGTAGMWRREAIDAAGGWSADTVTEDLDLSLRASKIGWTFRYVHDVVVPASLPVTLAAWRTQQHRWVCGGIQTARKHCRPKNADWRWLLSYDDKPAILLQNFAYFPLALLVTSLPFYPFVADANGFSWERFLWGGALFCGVFLPMALFFWRGLPGSLSWQKKTWHVLLALSLSGALVFNNCAGALSGLMGPTSVPFRRTPKGREEERQISIQKWQCGIELFFAVAYLVSLSQCVVQGVWGLLPFLLLLAFGFCYFSWHNLWTLGFFRAMPAGAVSKSRVPTHH